MASSEGECEICGGNYSFKEKKEMADSKYRILVCDKCKHQVARRAD